MRLPLSALGCLCALGACGDEGVPTRPVSIAFSAQVGGQPVNCDTPFVGLGAGGAEARLADARMFVSEVEARADDGTWVPVDLESRVWQRDGVALLDFEDGQGACASSGTDETNTEVTGTVPEGPYDGLRYTVGIPFSLNHNDQATAPAPFNSPGMFWNWRGGYKFVRVDWVPVGGDVPRWNVHLGSTACVADNPASPPDESCGRSNRPRVTLESFDLEASTVVVDLEQLVAGADLLANTPDSPPGCMSDPSLDVDECTPVYASLGLRFTDGACENACAGQTVFRAP